jgi:flagellar biosynthetic protein FliP
VIRSLLLLLALFAGGLAAVEVPDPVTAGGDARGDAVLLPGTDGSTDAGAVGVDGIDPVGALNGDAAGGIVLSIDPGRGPEGTSNVVKLMLLITVLAVAPGFIMMMTSFTRIIIVLGFARRALGTQTLPPNQVLLGLALFLTLFIMAPTLTKINNDALQPFLAEEITETVAIERATDHARDFLAAHTRKADLALFLKISGAERPETIDDVPFLTLIPAFITSELKTAFQMGFVLFLPFVVIDLVIAAILMSLGMMMLPPVMISLPFKVLLFVLVDGWTLLVSSLVASYGTG